MKLKKKSSNAQNQHKKNYWKTTDFPNTISRYLESIPQHKIQLTHESIVNSKAADTRNALYTLISLKNTQIGSENITTENVT